MLFDELTEPTELIKLSVEEIEGRLDLALAKIEKALDEMETDEALY